MTGQDSAGHGRWLVAGAVLSALALVIGLAPPASAGVVLMTPSISGSGSISYNSNPTWCTSGTSVANGTTTGCGQAVADPLVSLVAVPIGNATFVTWQGCPMPAGTVCQGFNPGAGTLGYSPVAIFTDSTGPTLTPSGGQASGADATAAFSWTTDETLSAAKCALDAGAYAPCSSTSSHTLSAAEGPHTFYVQGTDLSGNQGAAASTTFRVVETTLVSGPANPSNQSSPTFVFASGAGAGTTFDCSIDNVTLADCGAQDGAGHGTETFPGLSDGTHTFRVRAKNGSDVDRSTLVRSWKIDTVAPTTTLDPTTGPGEGALQAVTTETFAFTSEAAATFQCRLDGAAYAACASPRTVSGLRPGAHHFDVRAIDAAGNTGPAAIRSWTVSDVVVPPPAALKVTARAGKRATKITSLTLTGLGKAGATVVLRCQGRGCPAKLKGRGLTITTGSSALAMKKQVRKALRAGTKLVVTTRVPGRTTTFTVTIRAGKKPLVTRR